MTAELGQTQDPKALVPGDVGAVTATMWAMRSYGDSLHEAGTGLARIDTQEGWRGQAADQFRSRFNGEPRRWSEAGDCFHSAADALDSYSTTLQWAQQQAAEAIRLWNEGEAATAQAKADHERAVRQAQQEHPEGGVPDIPFHDPGQATRDAARQLLDRARAQLVSAGDTAERTVAAARDKAPEKPGFWAKTGEVLGNIGDGLLDVGAGVVNGLASFGNAMVHNPGDVGLAAAGIALTTISAAGEGLGVALDATGIGAVAGVPLNVASAAGIAAGATMTTVAMGNLAMHAASDNQVNPVQRGGDSSGTGGRAGTKTDRLKEHLTDRDLDAARRELNGEVVARKPDGTPWDHVDEVRNAQRGLANRINQIRRQLGDSRLSDADRAALRDELSEASRLLDHSEGFVPRS